MDKRVLSTSATSAIKGMTRVGFFLFPFLLVSLHVWVGFELFVFLRERFVDGGRKRGLFRFLLLFFGHFAFLMSLMREVVLRLTLSYCFTIVAGSSSSSTPNAAKGFIRLDII